MKTSADIFNFIYERDIQISLPEYSLDLILSTYTLTKMEREGTLYLFLNSILNTSPYAVPFLIAFKSTSSSFLNLRVVTFE